jgi:zinc resistance-associated protein
MWKTVLAGTAAFAIAGSSLAFAQQRDDDRAGPNPERHWQPSAEDIGASTDARIAALKAGLELTPEQEKTWPALETALRNLEGLRAGRMAARRDKQLPPNRIERLRREADAMTSTGAALRQLADAEEPFLNSLSDEQKRRFFFFVRSRRDMEFGRFARDFGGPRGREESRGPRGQFDGWPGRGDGDRPDREEWRERSDRQGMDWRGRGLDEPRGGHGWRDRRYGDLDSDND